MEVSRWRVRRDACRRDAGVRRRRRDAERELDRDADVELRVGAAGLQVLVQQVLELEAPDERVALDAAVGEVAAGDARALAVGALADAPAGQRARVERGRRASRRRRRRAGSPCRSGVCAGSTRTPTIPRTLVRHCQQRSVTAASAGPDDRLAGVARRRAALASAAVRPEPSDEGQTSAAARQECLRGTTSALLDTDSSRECEPNGGNCAPLRAKAANGMETSVDGRMSAPKGARRRGPRPSPRARRSRRRRGRGPCPP